MAVKYTAQCFPADKGSHAFLVAVPDVSWPAMRALLDKSALKHNQYLTLDVSLPHKPRTYGPKKQSPDDPVYQSNMLNGYLSQLAIHFGYTKTEMKEIMKDDVPEWPTESRRIGQRVKVRPVSEAEVSMEVESKAIDWCILIAAEEGLTLKGWKKEEKS